jgi:hypothetical protein
MVLWVLVLLGALGMPLLTAFALYRGGLAAGLSRRTVVAVAVCSGLLFGAWVVVSAVLGAAGVYGDLSAVVPWLGVAAVGAVLVWLLATRIPVVGRILAAPGTAARLVWPQSIRVVGVVFLIAMAQGRLPALFALLAGLGDLGIGVSAVLLVRRWRPGRAVWFNLLGLLDLVTAVTIGFLGGLSTHPVLALTPSTLGVTLLPLVLIPTTAVPLATALHVMSLARLSTVTRSAAVPVPV